MKTFILPLMSLLLLAPTTQAEESAPRPSPVARCIFQLGRLNPDLFEMIPANGVAQEVALTEEKNSFGQTQWRGEATLSSAKSDLTDLNYTGKIVVTYRKSASFWQANAGRLDSLTLLIDSSTGKTLALSRTSSDLLPTPALLEKSLKKGTLKAISTAWNPAAIPNEISTPFLEEVQNQWASSDKVNNSMALRLDSVCELKE